MALVASKAYTYAVETMQTSPKETPVGAFTRDIRNNVLYGAFPRQHVPSRVMSRQVTPRYVSKFSPP